MQDKIQTRKHQTNIPLITSIWTLQLKHGYLLWNAIMYQLLQTSSKVAWAEKNCCLRAKIILQYEQINKRHFCSTVVKKVYPGISCKMDTWDLCQLQPSVFKEQVTWRCKFSSLSCKSVAYIWSIRKMNMWDGVEFSSLKAISQFPEIKFDVRIFLLAFDS